MSVVRVLEDMLLESRLHRQIIQQQLAQLTRSADALERIASAAEKLTEEPPVPIPTRAAWTVGTPQKE